MKIGGEVECFLALAELVSNPSLLNDLPRPIRILGNGSNVLIDDQGLRGSMIFTRENSPQIKILNQSANELLVEVSAGTYLPSLAKSFAREAWSGTEYMVGVPGTIGGAVVQNAGANAQEIQDILESVRVLNLQNAQWETWSKEKCELRYRSSLFKSHPEFLVYSAVLRLRKDRVSDCEARIEKNLRYRKEKTPYQKASLGSMYTRLPGDKEGEWIYPGALIEAVGLKGTRIGGAYISELHANYFINEGQASFEDVYRLMLLTEKRVFEETGIRLQREIELWSDRLSELTY